MWNIFYVSLLVSCFGVVCCSPLNNILDEEFNLIENCTLPENIKPAKVSEAEDAIFGLSLDSCHLSAKTNIDNPEYRSVVCDHILQALKKILVCDSKTHDVHEQIDIDISTFNPDVCKEFQKTTVPKELFATVLKNFPACHKFCAIKSELCQSLLWTYKVMDEIASKSVKSSKKSTMDKISSKDQSVKNNSDSTSKDVALTSVTKKENESKSDKLSYDGQIDSSNKTAENIDKKHEEMKDFKVVKTDKKHDERMEKKTTSRNQNDSPTAVIDEDTNTDLKEFSNLITSNPGESEKVTPENSVSLENEITSIDQNEVDVAGDLETGVYRTNSKSKPFDDDIHSDNHNNLQTDGYITKAKLKHFENDFHSLFHDDNFISDESTGHRVFSYSLLIIIIVGGSFLLYHNKQKILALIVEGRHERRRRPNGVSYRKLETKT